MEYGLQPIPIVFPSVVDKAIDVNQLVCKIRANLHTSSKIGINESLQILNILSAKTYETTPISRQMVKMELNRITWRDATTPRKQLLVFRDH